MQFYFLIFLFCCCSIVAANQPSFANIVPELFAVNFPTAVATNISRQCIEDSRSFTRALLKREKWALQMYESSGKFPESNGDLYSTEKIQSAGLFDECLRIQHDADEFSGKYCTAMFTLEPIKSYEIDEKRTLLSGGSTISMNTNNWVAMYQLPQWFNSKDNKLVSGPVLKKPKKRPFKDSGSFLPFMLPSIGYCIPSSCSGEDFASALAQLVGQRAVGNVSKGADGQAQYKSVVTLAGDNYCYTQDMVEAAPDFDAADIIYICILSLLGCTILAATLHEAFREYVGKPIDSSSELWAISALNCFSILNSGRQLLSTRTAPSDVSCLHGIRFLSTSWIVVLHAFDALLRHDSYNRFLQIEDNLTWQMLSIANGCLAVDTFFLLSGLLVAYYLMRELDRDNGGRFKIPLFYLHRYLRLTVVYAFILGFIATLLVFIGIGPNWQIVRDMKESCKDNWWTNLLYINNYKGVRPNPKYCMFEAWYLACDMQMFWLSPLLIYPLWRWWKAGLAWLLTCIVALISASIATHAIWSLPPTDLSSIRPLYSPIVSYYNSYYLQMWARFPPYMVGIAVGWILYRTRASKIELNLAKIISGWITATFIGVSVVYGLVPYLNEETVPEINPFVKVAYGSLHRLGWAIAVGWVILACVNGYGGFANRLLTWKGFVPLGRLTYVAYLFHWNFVKFHMYYARKPVYYTRLDQALYMIAVLALTFIAAFVISLFVETPLLNLEKFIFRRPSKTIDQNGKNKGIEAEGLDVEMPFLNEKLAAREN